jgi:hypothetical protein
VTNFALLNNVDHQDVRIITERSANYGDNVMFAMTFPHEFRDIQACYPILFQRDKADEFFPLALFGFQPQENLFLNDSGWNAPYVPATIRRQPFLIGFQESKKGDDAAKTRVLSLDMDHPRVSKEAGERLFQPLGGRTPYLEDAANLLEIIYQGFEMNKRFVAAIEEHDLLEAISFDITLDDGSKNQLLGFHAINEEKLQELPGTTLERFSKEGFLMPIFMALASMTNMRTLIQLKNKALEG